MIPCMDRATKSSMFKKLKIHVNLILSENGELKYYELQPDCLTKVLHKLRKQKGVVERSQISALFSKLEKQNTKSKFKIFIFENLFLRSI